MRARIVLLSAAVIVLAVLILQSRPDEPTRGATFDATHLIADAAPGETATYRDERGETWTFRVEQVVPAGPDRPARIHVLSSRRDRRGQPLPGGAQDYTHVPSRHGLFPLMAPQDPDGYDRLWVWTRIREADLAWQGDARSAWRFDLIDPALPPDEGADHVVAWLDASVPVFGLVRWQRRGQTWDLVEWSPR